MKVSSVVANDDQSTDYCPKVYDSLKKTEEINSSLIVTESSDNVISSISKSFENVFHLTAESTQTEIEQNNDFYDRFLNRKRTIVIIKIDLGKFAQKKEEASTEENSSSSSSSSPELSIIRVHRGDDPQALSKAFCEAHSLSSTLEPMILRLISHAVEQAKAAQTAQEQKEWKKHAKIENKAAEEKSGVDGGENDKNDDKEENESSDSDEIVNEDILFNAQLLIENSAYDELEEIDPADISVRVAQPEDIVAALEKHKRHTEEEKNLLAEQKEKTQNTPEKVKNTQKSQLNSTSGSGLSHTLRSTFSIHAENAINSPYKSPKHMNTSDKSNQGNENRDQKDEECFVKDIL